MDFKLFKPYGYLSQFTSQQTKRTNKKMLGSLYDFPEGTMAIGRLDEASEGLLLLTTDGKTSQYIRSNKIEKEYYAQVDGLIDDIAIQKLTNGVDISTETGIYRTKECKVELLENTPKLPERAKKIRDERHGPSSWVSITLREGKFRQVRKMTAAVGFPTLRLVRVRIGTITVNDMNAGDVFGIELT
ncbi:MAG: pseudouridine synthase [Flavobacteriaceae bacterium]|nr:pseudouridine synthase [Flavobacteriaceae bacterium]